MGSITDAQEMTRSRLRLVALSSALALSVLVACGRGQVAPTTREPVEAVPLPDDDLDGVPDADDRCPTEPEDHDGFEDADGCPDLDNDQDRVPDVDDLCPNEAAHRSPPRADDVAGRAQLGCPMASERAYSDGPPGDADDDGYPDDVDLCPNHPETFPSTLDGGCTDDGDGCPDGGAVLLVACDPIIVDVVPFAAGSAAIPPEAQPLLDAVAEVLAAHAEFTLALEGHTDDRERGDLGERRAIAVREALVARGVAASRLTTHDLAATQPVMPVADQRGRALLDARERNRRVGFRVTNPPREPGRPH